MDRGTLLRTKSTSPMGGCNLCPRACGINRGAGQIGVCGQTNEIKLARAALHMWEEPCISGKDGSGAVFFSGCALHCVFCQNEGIANGDIGKTVTRERLVEIFFELREKGANNINLVTPGHFAPQIIWAINRAKKEGFDLPFVYNTSSYENVDTIKSLEGLIDIYLPDFKYFSSELSAKYSHAKDYPEVAKAVVAEMVRQTGPCKIVDDDEDGLIKSGTIVRHLTLPNCLSDSKQVIKYLHETYGDNIYISIMNQFTPMSKLENYPELNRTITEAEYEELVDYAIDIGVNNGFIQEGETAKESFIPAFDYEGV